MNKIEIKDALELKDALFIDTRSPKEYDIDHIEGSINIPILDDQERAEVGTLYKHDKDKAFNLGYSYYEKKLPKLTAEIRGISPEKKIIVYCWRGGLRSETVTMLVEDLGYNCFQLSGGYKKYREYLRSFFDSYIPKSKFIVLYGLAGCGKTRLLRELSPSIDLEGIAQHRSSLFGAIGLKPRTQKKFETILFNQLISFKDEPFVFIEGESRKVGDIFIPESVFKAMKKGIGIQINCDMNKRCKFIVEDYFSHEKDEEISLIIDKLKQPLGSKTVDELKQKLAEKDYKNISKILLKDYYDPKYRHYIDSVTINCVIDNDEMCLNKILDFTKNFINKA